MTLSDIEETGEQLGSSLGVGGNLELLKEEEKRKKAEWLAPYQFKPGQSGNPSGRKPGKSLKEYAKEMLAAMDDDERQHFLKGISKDKIWEMAEGKAKQDMALSGNLSISKVLTDLENGGHETSPEGLENPAPIQNQEQATAVSEVQAEPSADPLQSAQVVKEFNPEIPPTGIHY